MKPESFTFSRVIEMSVCDKCGREIVEGEPYAIREGKFYHDECERALPPPRPVILRPIVDDLISTIFEGLAGKKLPDVKSRHGDTISEHGITDGEIISELKRRLRRLR